MQIWRHSKTPNSGILDNVQLKNIWTHPYDIRGHPTQENSGHSVSLRDAQGDVVCVFVGVQCNGMLEGPNVRFLTTKGIQYFVY